MQLTCTSTRRSNDRSQRPRLHGLGDLALAAYHLARSRLLTRDIRRMRPTRLELGAAAFDLMGALGWEGPVPHSSTIAIQCEASGLTVCW